jgi:hypothetical protein
LIAENGEVNQVDSSSGAGCCSSQKGGFNPSIAFLGHLENLEFFRTKSTVFNNNELISGNCRCVSDRFVSALGRSLAFPGPARLGISGAYGRSQMMPASDGFTDRLVVPTHLLRFASRRGAATFSLSSSPNEPPKSLALSRSEGFEIVADGNRAALKWASLRSRQFVWRSKFRPLNSG